MIYVAHQDSASSTEALNALQEFFAKVDQIFSTYREDSEISLIRRGEKKESDFSDEMKEVITGCKIAREITEGAFDPWILPYGLDTSGYVKGWASQKGIEILNSFGIGSAQINSAGDIYLSGGFQHGPWSIGIRDPNDSAKIVKVFELENGAIATSGTYERGSHIFDPATSTVAIGARSATVIGPNGGLADALATALIVSGREGARWFANPKLRDYSAWVIERRSDIAWGINLT